MNKNSSDDDDDDITPVFSFRADNIMQKQREEYEKMLKKMEEDDSAKAVEDEENELLLKIHEKLKKTDSKRKANKKAHSPKFEEKRELPKRRTRLRNIISDDDVKKDEMSKKEDQVPINLPAHVKKKLHKIDLENTRERKRIAALNERILSSCVSSCVDDQNTSLDIEADENITLKLNYFSDIKKITVRKSDRFSSIISTAADLFKMKATEVTLCLRDEIIGLDDTPHSLNVKTWETIDCLPCKSNEELPEDSDINKILIKMQSNDSRKRIDIYAHKLEKFQDIMERYANLRSLPLKDLIFEFDGERITGSDTPDDLEMESGICVDVKVVGASLKYVPPSVPIVYPEKEVQHKMLDICVLD